MLRSRFDQARTSVARSAPGVEDARERMEIRPTSFLLKIVYYYEMNQSVEAASNLQVKKICAQCSTHGLSTLTFVRTFRSFTTTPGMKNRVSCYVSDAPNDASTDGERVANMEMVQAGSLSPDTLYPRKLTPSHLFPHGVFCSFRCTASLLFNDVRDTARCAPIA